MEAKAINLLKFLQGSKQFAIPIYQRTYDWKPENCRQLWRDICHIAETTDLAHFIGSVVYIGAGLYQSSSVPHLLVIDGQQRITTVSLLLAALGKAIEENNTAEAAGITRKKINNYYLFNAEEEGDDYYKLLLTQSDRATLIQLLSDRDLPTDAAPRLVDNYRFFQDCIKNSKLSHRQIYEGINKLIIVDVSLDKDRDDPQLIFDSLNSTGLDLTEADRVRNFMLMGLPRKEQEELYRDYWFPMEQGFRQSGNSELFGRFLRDYLTLPDGRIPNVDKIYQAFRSYARQSENGTMRDLATHLAQHAKIYLRLALARTGDATIDAILRDINTLRVNVAYPLLLKLALDYENQSLTRDEFCAILRLLESYVFRRSICGIPTNSLNKTFANFSKEIDPTNYLASVQTAFALKDSYFRFPTDDELRRTLLVRDVYNFSNRRYLLEKLERANGSKERVDVSECTIEHILPQNENLSDAWQQELGANWQAVQSQYLHTLGNLTLTAYNSSLSDRPFIEKRDIKDGFRDSPLRLNRRLATLEHWNETEIVRRAEELATLATQVWPYPHPPQEVLAARRSEANARKDVVYTIDEHLDYVSGELREVFQALRERILGLDAAVREEPKKHYVAYKLKTNFADVVAQKSRLRLSLNIDYEQLSDPQGRCQDVSQVGQWGNGNVRTYLSSLSEIDDVMFLVRQAYDRQANGG